MRPLPFLLVLLFITCNALSQSDTTTHRVGLRVSPLSPGDSLLIALSYPGEEPYIMIVKPGNSLQYFPMHYKKGDTLLLSQWMWSTRECNFNGQAMVRIFMGDSDRIVNCNCGQNPAAGTVVGIRVNAPPPGKTVHFRVRLRGQEVSTLAITGPSNLAYFQQQFNPGDTITVLGDMDQQMWCIPKGNSQLTYIIGNDSMIINASCGMLPYIKMGAMNPNETFSFEILNKLYPKDTLLIKSLAGPLAGVRSPFLKNRYYEGDTVWVRQIGGPRVCNLPPYTVIFNGFNYIEANCIAAGNDDLTGGSLQKSRVAGTYSAPPGTTITIQNNGGNDIILTSTAYNNNGNNSIGFSFPQIYDAGTAYTVSIKSQPPNCKCAVQPFANGITPVDSLQLNIICSPSVELVSRSSDDRMFNTFYETLTPVIGGKGNDEGRFVAFVSSGSGMDGSTGKFRQIYWRDMRSGVTKLISRSSSGDEANGNNFAPAISADGRSVAFESYASNLSSEDNNNGLRDVYVWKEGVGVSLISKRGNSESFEPTISGNGSVVAFSSSASNLTAGVDGNSTVNVYVADASGSIQLITKDIRTGKGAGGSAPSISEDGNKVVFSSFTSTLVQNDINNLWDIFLWQRGAAVLRRISMAGSGTERDQGTESASRVVWASISGNGNYIVYSTTATNMVSGDNNKLQDVFICNSGGGGVRRISVTVNNLEGDGDSPIDQGGRIGISYDGTWITYNTNAGNLGVAKGNIILQNTKTGKIIPVTNSIYNTTGRPMVSRNGGFVIAGCSEKFDKRFASSGVFSFFTGPSIQ